MTTPIVGNLSYERSRARRLVALSRVAKVESEKDKGMGLSPGFGHVMVDRMTEALSFFTKSEPVLRSFKEQATEFVCADNSIEHIKKAKAFCTWFRAVYLECKVSKDLALRGAFGDWAWRRLRDYSFSNCYLWSTFYMFKNCALPVEPDVVDENLKSHSLGVRGPDRATDESCEEAVNSLAPLLEDLARKVEKAYLDSRREDGLLPCEFPTTNKASLDFAGLNGGQVGELLMRVFGESDGPIPRMPFIGLESELRRVMSVRFGVPMGVFQSDESLFNRLIWRRWGRPDGTIQGTGVDHVPLIGRHLCVVERHSWDPDEFEARMSLIEAQEDPVIEGNLLCDPLTGHSCLDTWETFPQCREFWTVRCNELLREYYATLDGTWTLPEGSIDHRELARDSTVHRTEDGRIIPVVRVVPVCEPLKVRVITIGSAITTLFSSWWQKTVHGILQSYPCFKLLGRSPTTREIDAVRDFAVRLPGEELGYASSDFSGASNGTPEAFRVKLMTWINKYLPSDWRRVPEICNGRHWIKYPKLLTTAENVEQVTGTLMGERTSFPILSLQVAGTHVMALRRLYGNRPSFWRLLRGLAVNGDDRLAYTTKAQDDCFWRCCNLLQFSESIGKSYWHPVYANINSQSYSSFETGYSVKTGYFASGLYHGQKKLATDEFDPSDVLTAVLDSCSTSKMEHDVCQSFLRKWRGDLRKKLAGRNLFVPCVLGGVGHRAPNPFNDEFRSNVTGKVISIRRNWKIRITDEQQELASQLYWSDPQVWISPPCQLKTLESPCRREIWDTKGVVTFWDRKRIETIEAVRLHERASELHQLLADVSRNLGGRIPKLSKDELCLPARRLEMPRNEERTLRLIRCGVYAYDLRKVTKHARNLLVDEVYKHIDTNVLLPPRSRQLAHRLADALPPVHFDLRGLGFGNCFFKSWRDEVRCLVDD